ncbi:MAG TPA: 2-hydroxyacyl-CoA dehydratase [Dehalococcoidia bacterium]|nr:2-hydroxyacyl-CoA dehydratase [Dehalococcoidia bacterium]
MAVIEKFQEVLAKRHQYAKDWKAQHTNKVIGWLCSYSPVEIIYASGMLPVRILGSHEVQDVTDRYLFPTVCPFSRDALAQGLKGRYDYLDGITMARTCSHVQGTFDNWKNYIPTPLKYYIWMPNHLQSPRAKPLLVQEYKSFIQALEKFTGKKITDQDLDKAIELYNTNRKLMKQVYEFRKQEEPPITGAECMEMVVASQLMDVAEHNKLLEQLLKELPNRKLERNVGVRLMMVGSEMDDIVFVKMMETLNCTVVIDEHCTGSRYFWDEVKPGKDPIAAIAARYVDRWPCPAAAADFKTRGDRILQHAKDWNSQGVLVYQQKFCDPHEFDIPWLLKNFKDINIPTLVLEFDVTIPFGQFRTRIEAFLEILELELV